MKPHIEVAAVAQAAADLLDGTQFIVMERRTWERLMPSGAERRAEVRTTTEGDATTASEGNK